jgi:hypothetical protein
VFPQGHLPASECLDSWCLRELPSRRTFPFHEDPENEHGFVWGHFTGAIHCDIVHLQPWDLIAPLFLFCWLGCCSRHLFGLCLLVQQRLPGRPALHFPTQREPARHSVPQERLGKHPAQLFLPSAPLFPSLLALRSRLSYTPDIRYKTTSRQGESTLGKSRQPRASLQASGCRHRCPCCMPPDRILDCGTLRLLPGQFSDLP